MPGVRESDRQRVYSGLPCASFVCTACSRASRGSGAPACHKNPQYRCTWSFWSYSCFRVQLTYRNHKESRRLDSNPGKSFKGDSVMFPWHYRNRSYQLRYVFWEATSRCNLHCLHCGSACTDRPLYSEPTGEQIVAVFRDIARISIPGETMIGVTGGEPLLRADLIEIMSEIHKMGFAWGMVSNGLLINESLMQRCIEAGMTTVAISLDGTEKLHNWLRGNTKAYGKAVMALEMLAASGTFDVVEAMTCVHLHNVQYLDDIFRILEQLHISAWRLMTVFPRGRALQNPFLVVTAELLHRVFEYIQEKRAGDSGMAICYSDEGFLGDTTECTVRDHRYYCGAGRTVAGLLADGSYSGCPSLPREWIQGHISELSFSHAWKDRFGLMRKRDWMKQGPCSTCSSWARCQGGSLHLWDISSGHPLVCHMNLLRELRKSEGIQP